ncbi:heat-inducible transcription repressor HrcA [Alphaproteobacteria bacterium]|nr:heat-inducible transcription repressor HrcA [Alphaproteobacteria bacterium]
MGTSDICKNKRYIDIFKKLVDVYIETGEPVGSRSLSKMIDNQLSPATIRNVMADLEDAGILCSDHSSAGRKPTEKGWRFFVNTLVETENITDIDKKSLLALAKSSGGKSIESILEDATDALSKLSNCVSLIFSSTTNESIKHIDFVLLSPGKAIVIIVNEGGIVENRLIDIPKDVDISVLEKARNYINDKLAVMSLKELQNAIYGEVTLEKNGIDSLAKEIMASGIDIIKNDENNDKIIVKGQSNLISKARDIKTLEILLKKLDEKKSVRNLLDELINGQGIQIFIGSETKMFELLDCSIILAPYHDSNNKLIGTIGVIGSTRMRYSKEISLVTYTAEIIGNIIKKLF